MKSYEELKEKITLFIDEESKETFDELILEAHAFQKNNCEILRKYSDLHCKSPSSWREIVPIPTEAFKNTEKLISFPEKILQKLFSQVVLLAINRENIISAILQYMKNQFLPHGINLIYQNYL